MRETKTSRSGDPRRAWAIGIFGAAYLVSRIQSTGAAPIDLRPQYWELPALAGLALVTVGGAQREAGRVLPVFWVAVVVATVGYAAHGGAIGAGRDGAYLFSAVLWTMYLLVAALVAFVFFDEHTFYRVWWRIAFAATVVALLGFALAKYFGVLVLAQYADYGGGLRLTGLLSEPSAWAPVLSSLVLIAARERRWFAGAVIVVAIVVSRSPTVILTLTVTVLLLALLRPGRLHWKVLLTSAVVLVSPNVLRVFNDAGQADVLQASSSPPKILLGRVLSGLQYIQTGGQVGSNDRFDGAQDVLATLRSNGWLWTGRGLGSSDVYFTNVLQDFRAYSLPLSILFDLGLIGLAVYVVLVCRAIWRLRNRPIGLVLVPFVVASSINSAQGVQFYKFAVVAVLVYGLSWRRVPARAGQLEELLTPTAASPVAAP